MNTNKEYIKNFIIRSIKGKVDQTEVQQVKESLMNYSREDLRDSQMSSRRHYPSAAFRECAPEKFRQV